MNNTKETQHAAPKKILEAVIVLTRAGGTSFGFEIVFVLHDMAS
jgi:hypothetical protein